MYSSFLTATLPILLAATSITDTHAQHDTIKKNEMLHKATIVILQKQCEEIMGWSWTNDGRTPQPNLGGAIAVALLESYRKDPLPSVWITLNQYTMHLKKTYANKTSMPFKADIEYLAGFANEFNDKSAAALSREFFERMRKISPNGHDEFKRISTARATTPHLIGYDVAIGIRAAHALGENDYAEDLANAALTHQVISIENRNNHYQIISTGAFLYALTLLQQKQYAKTIERLGQNLQALQRNNGSWAINNTQATAYALLGLTAAKGHFKSAAALKKAHHWLMNSQLKAGGWGIYNDGLPEPFVGENNTLVQAETLQAILAGL